MSVRDYLLVSDDLTALNADITTGNTTASNIYSIVNGSNYGNKAIKTAIDNLQTTANTIDANTSSLQTTIDAINTATSGIQSTLTDVNSNIATVIDKGTIRWSEHFSSWGSNTQVLKGSHTIVDGSKVAIIALSTTWNGYSTTTNISWDYDANSGEVLKLTAKTIGFLVDWVFAEYY